MLIELKDTADTVVHDQFQKWRKNNPRGIFLSVETKGKANLHGSECQHLGSTDWLLENDGHSLTKKLKVLDDGRGSLRRWADKHSGIVIHRCTHCLRDKLIEGWPLGIQSARDIEQTMNDAAEKPAIEAAFLLAWNPERFKWNALQEDIAQIQKRGFVTLQWSCGNRKDLPEGSEIFLIRLGSEPKGIIGRGIAASKAIEGTHWEADKRRKKIKGWNVDVRITELSEKPIIAWEVLQTPPLSRFRWSIQASGIRLPEAIVQAMHSSWAAGVNGITTSDPANQLLAKDTATELAILNDPSLSVTVKKAIISARRGQGRFRENVLRAEPKCRLTGVTDPDHLIASHIKPWKDSTNDERLSGDNGLMLGPHVDHLFDKGYIGFTNAGNLLVSPKCRPAVLTAWGISRSTNVRPFRAAQWPYLLYHREHIFRQ
jgi:hypothetical protein